MKGQLRIDEMFAFIIIDDDGTEGIPAIHDGHGMALPLVGADMARVNQLRALVATSPDFRGKKVTIAKFSHREDIAVVNRAN